MSYKSKSHRNSGGHQSLCKHPAILELVGYCSNAMYNFLAQGSNALCILLNTGMRRLPQSNSN